MKATRITFDVETYKTDDPAVLEYVRAKAYALVPKGNKDVKALWMTTGPMDERAAEAVEKTNLNPMFGRILCANHLTDFADGSKKAFQCDLMRNPADELARLAEHWEETTDADTLWIGHNITNFDLGFLVNGFRKIGAPPPTHFPVFRNGYWRGRIYDTMQHIPNKQAGFIKLTEAYLAYGLGEAKEVIWEGEPMDGSRVAAAYDAGAYDLLLRYCDLDCVMERRLYLTQTANGTYGTPEARLTPLAELREIIAKINASDALTEPEKDSEVGNIVRTNHLAA